MEENINYYNEIYIKSKSRGVTGGIDYWFVSHLDTDHVSGLIEALESGYPACHCDPHNPHQMQTL